MTESATRPEESDPRFLAPVREGETVVGKYVVGRLLGLGGMGAVFEAQDLQLERRVALKVLLPRLVTSPTAAARFIREARAATRITSEHVVKLLDIATLPDGTPLLVMEYLEGHDLRGVLREVGPLDPRLAVDYLLQALQAVAEGHVQAIVHRDLKPSNLFLTERADGTPLIKVLDFGIAKTLQPGGPADFALTSSEDMQLGSPTYMPPEQFQNPRDVDARADIWALGVTLYELISGRVPFQGLSYAELVSQVLSGPPDSLKTSLPGVTLPDGLEAIVVKCLQKKRDDRYLNAVELAVALAPFGSDDARLSLTRVSGLSRPRTPNPTTPREVSGGYEATLPVPVGLDLGRHTGTSSGSRPVSHPIGGAGGSRRLGVVLGLAAAAIVAVFVWQHHSTPDAPVGAAPQKLASSLSSLKVDSAAPSTAKAAEAVSTASVAPEAASAASASKVGASIAIERRTRAGHVAAPNGAPNVPVGATAADAALPPNEAVKDPIDGHASDELIEKLISKRH